ncbi:hypothetical protein EXE48_17785 [Halorubrum sp. ASP1]|uniref:Uncharacterized protein n=2 Tax=Haloferacaceae TaxID=1644056 RepID=A0A0N1IV38_9EURY|nr:hypothetical protein AMR74_04135 [Halorubrum tropicale]TKX57768.1 hypothetical protein EXE48_17785 [Halorubrum sp. ASP1]
MAALTTVETERGPMPTTVRVRCTDCAYDETFDSLRRARTALDDHERATSHAVDWEIGGLSAGVERAGDDAGVCGRDGCANANSPLLDHGPASAPDRDV